jgi:primary-amine oxidase
VKLTGIISNGAVAPGEKPPWGELVTPEIYGPIHQHFFNARLHMMVDGPQNSVYEVNTVADPPGPQNPYGAAFRARSTLLGRESEAQRIIDPLAGRFWKIVNPSVKNRLGEPVGYKLMPGENVLPFAAPEAQVTKRAGFMTKHLWVTRYDPREQYATGDYPNQHPGGAGLPSYVRDDAPESADAVVWHTFGAHHVVRQDWPVMPGVISASRSSPPALRPATRPPMFRVPCSMGQRPRRRVRLPGGRRLASPPSMIRHGKPRDGA